MSPHPDPPAQEPWLSELPSSWQIWEEFKQTYSPRDKEEAWVKTDNIVRRYSEEMVQRWNMEIDTLLVYAGLFSAILTAFNVQSYQLLQGSSPDPTLLLLQKITMQMDVNLNGETHAGYNATHPYSFDAVAPQSTSSSSAAVALNVLWFSGLVCSLAAASIGITIKQWTHEFRTGLSGSCREAARLRQYRLNNIIKWRVADLVALLPILLQLALVLFFAGLLLLLWTLHEVVAAVVSVLVGMTLTLILGSALIPVIWKDCCYLSPPTFVVYHVTKRLKIAFWRFAGPYVGRMFACVCQMSWIPYTLRRRLRHSSTVARTLSHTAVSWHGREQLIVSQMPLALDTDSIVTAYIATMDVHYLDTAAPILCGFPCPIVLSTFDRIHDINLRNYGGLSIEKISITTPSDFWMATLLNLALTSHENPDDCLSTRRMQILGRYLLTVDDSTPSRLSRSLLALSEARLRFGVQYHTPLYSSCRRILRGGLQVPTRIMRIVASAMEHNVHELVNLRQSRNSGHKAELFFIMQSLKFLIHCYVDSASSQPNSSCSAYNDSMACASRALAQATSVISSLSAEESQNSGAGFFMSSILRTIMASRRASELMTVALLDAVEDCVARVRDHGNLISIMFVDNPARFDEEIKRCREMLGRS